MHMHVTVRKCLACLSDWVRTGFRMCYCLRGRSSSCLSLGCFLPSHFPAAGRGISQTLCPHLASFYCLLTQIKKTLSNQMIWSGRSVQKQSLCIHMQNYWKREKQNVFEKFHSNVSVTMTGLLIDWLCCELLRGSASPCLTWRRGSSWQGGWKHSSSDEL